MRLLPFALGLLLTGCSGAPEPAAVAPRQTPAAPAPAAVVDAPRAGDAMASRALLDDYLAAWNSHDADRTAAFLAEDVVLFDSLLGNAVHGRVEVRNKAIAMYLRAVPDGQWALRNEPVVSATGFSYEWSLTGVNQGDWASYLHGKGQKIDFKGITIVRLKDGKIVYQANYFDTHALGLQAGW